MCVAGDTFKRIHERLRTAINYKQQLDTERMKRYTLDSNTFSLTVYAAQCHTVNARE